MNEITRIRLARVSYDIDLDAKKALEKYTKDIKRSLGSDSDVYDDVEVRMTEILADRGVNGGDIIMLGDVTAIRAQLGEPTVFEGSETSDHKEATPLDAEASQKVVRRYYRDEEHALVGGVIAGLAAYTGWDVTLLRLLAVALGFISFGWAVVCYLAVWIVAPAAKTLGEKMEMRGEPVTLDTISNSFHRVSDSVSQRVDDLKAAKAPRSIGRRLVEIAMVMMGVLLLLGSIGMIIVTICFSMVGLMATANTAGAGMLTWIQIIEILAVICFCIFAIIGGIALISRRVSRRHSIGMIASFTAGVALMLIGFMVGLGWIGSVGSGRASGTIQAVGQTLQDRYHINGDGEHYFYFHFGI